MIFLSFFSHITAMKMILVGIVKKISLMVYRFF